MKKLMSLNTGEMNLWAVVGILTICGKDSEVRTFRN